MNLINHNYESDIALYPQYNHSINFIIAHRDFDKEFVSDLSNKIFITADKEFAEKSGALLIKSEYDSKLFGELTFIKWIANYLRDGDWRMY